MWNPWMNGGSGWIYLAMLAPNFIISPGLLQKVYGARDDRTVRLGVGLNAAGLLVYAFVPVLLGMAARVLHPDLLSGTVQHPDMTTRELALPYLFMYDLPFWVGAVGLAAVFSAEVSAADAVLFMLATSLSQDLYKRFVNPAASDAQVLTVARLASVAGGLAAVAVAFLSKTVIDALSVFYTLVSVSLFVPVVAGLYLRRPRAVDALATIGGGVIAVVAAQLWNGGKAIGVFTPAMLGLAAGAAAFLVASTLMGHGSNLREKPVV
jgi:SSS family solute:Na+ symporter